MDSPERTALVILVPEAETLVKEFRDRYDPSAAEGMPAHITVLYPFKYTDEIGKDVVDALQTLFSRHSRFSFTLEETRRFPNALYLAPRPDVPFKELIRAATERYPETPPYGGAFSTVVPHLTIAQVIDPQELYKISDEFDRASRGRLPIHSSAEKVWLMKKQEGKWQPRISFAFNIT
jgi:2'-5' RNA ligase